MAVCRPFSDKFGLCGHVQGYSKPQNIVVGVNAGHGTSGGTSVKTLCHPDGSAKTTGGTTGAGATKAVAVWWYVL